MAYSLRTRGILSLFAVLAPKRRMAGWLALFMISLMAASQAWPQEENVRFSSLGHQMICACGCNQILLECNHVGCPLSDGMRHELLAAIQTGEADKDVLAFFVNKYGPTILAAPTHAGFDEVAWVMPFAVLLLSFAVAIAIIRAWRNRPLAATAAAGADETEAYRDQIRQETEEP